MSRKPGLIAFALIASLFVSRNAHAGFLTIDEYLYEGNILNSLKVQGTINASVSGSTLTLVVKNTMASLAVEGNGSHNLLTGLGLTLPDTWVISGGTVKSVLGTGVNFNENAQPSLISGGQLNISSEWGFSQPPTSGHLISPAAYDYGLGIGTLTADITVPFATGNVAGPANSWDGPDFGVYSSSLGASSAGGVIAVGDYVTIELALGKLDTNGDFYSATVSDANAFLDAINSNYVALMFASPNNRRSSVTDGATSNVPEPASLMLTGLGLCGFFGVARRRRKS